MDRSVGTPPGRERSLTLERGLRALRVLGDHPEGLTVSELAALMDTHRAGVYRLLDPLIAQRLVTRLDGGRHCLGPGLLELAALVRPRLQEVSEPVLRQLADELSATTALSIRDGHDAVVVAVVAPTTTDLHITYRTGLRHSVETAASGLAILSGNPPLPGERAEVAEARARGWSRSSSELLAGATGVAAPIPAAAGAEAAISAVWVQDRGEREASAGAAVVAAALRVARALA